MNNNFYVYALFKPNNKDPFYIGKGKGRRAYDSATIRGSHGSPRKLNIIKKLNSQGLVPIIEVLKDNITEEQSLNLEVKLINHFKREIDGGCLSNYTLGGIGTSGRKHSDETKEKIRQTKVGILQTQESNEKRRQTQLGVPKNYSKETLEFMRINNTGKNNSMFGKTGKKHHSSKAIIIEGHEYGSLGEASRQLNIHVMTIHKRLNSKTDKFKEWNYK